MSVKEAVLEKLASMESQPSTQNITYKTVDRLALVSGAPPSKTKGKKPNAADGKGDDLHHVLVEEEPLLEQLIEVYTNSASITPDKDREKLATNIAYILATQVPKSLMASGNSNSSYSPTTPLSGTKTIVHLLSKLLLKDIMNAKLTSSSFSIKLFTSFCQLICGDFLKPTISTLAEEIPEDVKPNSELLIEHTWRALNGFLKSVIQAPLSVWHICIEIFEQLTTMEPKQAPKAIMKILSLGLFAPAIENPESFSVELGKKKSKKQLQYTADLIRTIASINDGEDVKLKDLLIKKFDMCCDLINQWMSQPHYGVAFSPEADQSTLDNALGFVYDKIHDRLEAINRELIKHESGNTIAVTCKTADLVRSLLPTGPNIPPNVRSSSKSTIY